MLTIPVGGYTFVNAESTTELWVGGLIGVVGLLLFIGAILARAADPNA